MDITKHIISPATQFFTVWPWPLTMTYNPRLAKVKVDPHAKKSRPKVKWFKQESAHRQTDGHTPTHTHGCYQTYYLPCYVVDNEQLQHTTQNLLVSIHMAWRWWIAHNIYHWSTRYLVYAVQTTESDPSDSCPSSATSTWQQNTDQSNAYTQTEQL